MSEDGWSRGALVALVKGGTVMMRGTGAQVLPVPDWLAPAANDVGKQDSAESMDMTHPDDRALLVESFGAALAVPGEPLSIRIRSNAGGGWRHSEVTWLNLIDHDDVSGILCVVHDVDGPEIEPPSGEDSGAQHSATNWMILELDASGAIRSGRGAVREILGSELEELVGRNAVDHLHPDSLPSAIDNWIALMDDPVRTRTSRQQWCHRDGHAVWIEASFLVHDDDVVEVVMLDITERMAYERALAESQAEVAALAEDFRLVADEVPTPVFRCDQQGRVDFRNSQWEETFASLGDVERLHDVVDPAARGQVDEMLERMSRMTGGSEVLEVPAADGFCILAIRCRAVGAEGAVRRFVGSISDVTATVHLRHQATHDELTGLANRAMLSVRIDEAIVEDPAGTLVVFIDLDGFKEVNDRFGHEAGDTVLVEVARRLVGAVRPGDAVGRHGGDEFVLVCGGVAESDTALIMERLRSEVFGDLVEFDGGTWSPAASIGHTRARPGDVVASVLRRADQAMFERKRSRGLRRTSG